VRLLRLEELAEMYEGEATALEQAGHDPRSCHATNG
jgi:hypothetical protein